LFYYIDTKKDDQLMKPTSLALIERKIWLGSQNTKIHGIQSQLIPYSASSFAILLSFIFYLQPLVFGKSNHHFIFTN
jgi:hypothetical protein